MSAHIQPRKPQGAPGSAGGQFASRSRGAAPEVAAQQEILKLREQHVESWNRLQQERMWHERNTVNLLKAVTRDLFPDAARLVIVGDGEFGWDYSHLEDVNGATIPASVDYDDDRYTQMCDIVGELIDDCPVEGFGGREFGREGHPKDGYFCVGQSGGHPTLAL